MPDRFDTNPAVDTRLIADVLLGKEGAARALVSRLAPIIRRVANRLAPPEHRKDLIQEVWTHLWKQNCRVLQRWDRRGPLVHYVAVVASNLIRDRLQAQGNPPPISINNCSDPPDPDDPERLLAVRQLAKCIEEAKGRLSTTYREIIHLRHEMGLKHREIAATLAIPIGSVGNTLARGERYLRDELLRLCADLVGDFRAIFRSPD